jgi:hypothetical protein
MSPTCRRHRRARHPCDVLTDRLRMREVAAVPVIETRGLLLAAVKPLTAESPRRLVDDDPVCAVSATEVLVEPRQDFGHDVAARRNVPCVLEDNVAFVRWWRAEALKERPLRRLDGKREVVLAAD